MRFFSGRVGVGNPGANMDLFVSPDHIGGLALMAAVAIA